MLPDGMLEPAVPPLAELRLAWAKRTPVGRPTPSVLRRGPPTSEQPPAPGYAARPTPPELRQPAGLRFRSASDSDGR